MGTLMYEAIGLALWLPLVAVAQWRVVQVPRPRELLPRVQAVVFATALAVVWPIGVLLAARMLLLRAG